MARDKTELTDLTPDETPAPATLDDAIRRAILGASLEGRLSAHEALVADIADAGKTDGLAAFCKYIRVARYNLDKDDRANAMTYVTKADAMLLEISFANDPDRLRGVKTKQGASLGGKSTARETAQKTKAVIQEMERLQRANPERPVTWLANVAFRNGKGPSAEANRAAWYRRAPK